MTHWPASKGLRVLAALLRIGWSVKRQTGSHRTLHRHGFPDYVFAFHDGDEIGPRMLSRIAKRTGLRPEDLSDPLLGHPSFPTSASSSVQHLLPSFSFHVA